MAEGVGFEPTETRKPQRFSRPSHSSALASLQGRTTLAKGVPALTERNPDMPRRDGPSDATMGPMSDERRRQRPDFWRDLGTRLLEHHGVATVVWRSGRVTIGNGVALDLVDDDQSVDKDELLRRLDAAFVLPEEAHDLRPGEERVVEVEIAATRALLRASAIAVGGVDEEGPLALVTFRAPLETPVDPAHLARLEAMLHTTSDIITVLDLKGRIMFSNSAAGRLTGLAGTEVNGMNMVELVHPEDVAHVMDAFERGVLRGEDLGVIEVRLRMADGEWHHFEARISGAVEVDGTEGRVITLNDVSDRVGREADTLSHRRRLESIVENIDEVIVILGEDLSVLWASPGIDQLIDAPAYTNIGENAFNDMHPDDIEGVSPRSARRRHAPTAGRRPPSVSNTPGSDGAGSTRSSSTASTIRRSGVSSARSAT